MDSKGKNWPAQRPLGKAPGGHITVQKAIEELTSAIAICIQKKKKGTLMMFQPRHLILLCTLLALLDCGSDEAEAKSLCKDMCAKQNECEGSESNCEQECSADNSDDYSDDYSSAPR